MPRKLYFGQHFRLGKAAQYQGHGHCLELNTILYQDDSLLHVGFKTA